MAKIFANDNQLQEWVAAAGAIRNKFGTDKALGYLLGEKFYNTVAILHSARQIIRTIDAERKQPDFCPVRVTRYKDREHVTNLDEMYAEEKEIITEVEKLLAIFVTLVRGSFDSGQIKSYFESNPRLGIAHLATDEEFEFLVRKGAIEHSIETEVEDALILGDMMKYFGVPISNGS